MRGWRVESAMGGNADIEWREALYRQVARVPGLPAGLRPEMIKRAEWCIGHGVERSTAESQHVEGCKGAIAQ